LPVARRGASGERHRVSLLAHLGTIVGLFTISAGLFAAVAALERTPRPRPPAPPTAQVVLGGHSPLRDLAPPGGTQTVRLLRGVLRWLLLFLAAAFGIAGLAATRMLLW
jgi:hypothetical protein